MYYFLYLNSKERPSLSARALESSTKLEFDGYKKQRFPRKQNQLIQQIENAKNHHSYYIAFSG